MLVRLVERVHSKLILKDFVFKTKKFDAFFNMHPNELLLRRWRGDKWWIFELNFVKCYYQLAVRNAKIPKPYDMCVFFPDFSEILNKSYKHCCWDHAQQY
jgi:hypothetical protein